MYYVIYLLTTIVRLDYEFMLSSSIRFSPQSNKSSVPIQFVNVSVWRAD